MPFNSTSEDAAIRSRYDQWLQTFAWSLLGFMLLVILWGAFVRTSGSGAGCGVHWPLCNGEFFPRHPRLATLIEFIHRSTSGILFTSGIGLAVWVFRMRPRGSRTRKAALWVVALLITEALLGAALVLGGWVDRNASAMRVIMQCIHFTNTMLLVASLTLTAWWLRPDDAAAASGEHGRDLALSAVLLVLLVGATGSVAALADTLFPSPSLSAALANDFAASAPLILRMRWVHPAASFLALLCVGALCWRLRSRMAILVACLLGLQMLLGLADVLLLAPTWMQVVHLLGADLFWIALVILASQTLQRDGRHISERAQPKPRAFHQI